ncbi:hypothetical protein [Acidithiobacillus ferrivorans]|uniref:DUF4399 domain-containing protein n=1 Tax=Acidithiobacillus ferrivorans TaxID=160808 RepID=A0A1B9C0T0_9PROT|nr:hypothetical protein [Acidithiobacillus ferrivorans]MBN6740884.1 hypothetical protein [Acidithiobacillus sp. MC6.1]OCB03523.1 hypothetical protein BBC27_07540 [Acidithiobacillus ferrivorans]QQD72603.1 hypothetical protein H2515_14700 [Acidithiobacillus ferrivorans]
MNPNISRILWVLAAVAFSSAMAPSEAAVGHPSQPAMGNMDKATGGSGTTESGKKYIKILSPANGAQLSAGTPVVLSYDVTLAPNGNHIHVYVDKHMAGLSHELKGNFSVGKLAPGTHTICIKEATAAHVLIGVNRCIVVTVK